MLRSVLRSALLFMSRQAWLRHWVETSSLTERMTSRFVAGMTLADEIEAIKKLDSQCMLATLDCLGENVTSLAEAEASRDAYLQGLAEIERNKLPATVSIKLSQFGLDLSEETCLANVDQLTCRAKQIGTRVEIDMESSDYVDRTLRIVRLLHDKYGCVRSVIQAYLYRSEEDIRDLSHRGIPVRLCKGAYQEPVATAFPQKTEVDANYAKLMKLLLDEGTYPAIASHDEAMLNAGLEHIRAKGITPDRFEFQMLYGVRRDLQQKLVSEGFRIRLYVPYGDAWYPYFMRRLAERPANVLFLARNLLRS